MRSIKETTTNTIIIKKSEFITTLIPCNDEKEIKDLIELYSKDDATHNCVAYRVGPLEKADDDGEPSGCACKVEPTFDFGLHRRVFYYFCSRA